MIPANDPDLHGRVAALETSVASIGEDLQEVRSGQVAMGGQIDRLVEALTSTDGRAAERAHAVKVEIRDEAERKARERGEMFKNGLALIGGIVLVVSAIGAPYLGKIDAAARGQEVNTGALGSVRETIAQQGAEIARNRDAGEIGRERNRWQDEKLFDLAQRTAAIEARGARN